MKNTEKINRNMYKFLEKSIFVKFLGGVSKTNFSIFQVFWTVYSAVCHILISFLGTIIIGNILVA